MALSLASKSAVRFEWTDGDMDTTVTINPMDSEETIKRKLRKILALAGEEQPPLPERIPGVALGMAQTGHPRLIPVTEAEGMAMKKERPGSVTNGWAATAGVVPPVPELPERLQGEVELIPPEEQG